VALAHPSVAPYVARVEPHITMAIQTTKPVLLRARSEWNAHILPQWNKRVVPQWNKYATPRIHHVQRTLRHYRRRVAHEYSKHVAPGVRTFSNTLQRWHHNSQPYIILASSKCRDSYKAVKPYAIPIWIRVEARLMQLVAIVQAQRRQFVDPHVARIWEKVKELSSGKPKGASSILSTVPAASTTTSRPFTSSQHSESIASLSASSIAQMPASTPSESPESTHSELSVREIPEVTSTTLETAPPDVVDTAIVSAEVSPITETIESTFSVASASAPETPSEVSSVITASEQTSTSADTRLPPSKQEDDIDLDVDLKSFLADLGIQDESPDGEPSTSIEAPPPEVSETAEDEAERLRRQEEFTANKRADIMRRHSNWEDELETLMKTKRKELRKALVAIRKSAAAELKESSQIRDQINLFVEDAEKYLKGVEMSLRTLKKDSQKNEDKLSFWTRVVKKVEEKFEARTRETEAAVNEWYSGVVGREIQEVSLLFVVAPAMDSRFLQQVQSAHTLVRHLAEQGQANVGMDYAWLDDVTYQDWQRYHDLLRSKVLFLI